jgi:hypothetical protein
MPTRAEELLDKLARLAIESERNYYEAVPYSIVAEPIAEYAAYVHSLCNYIKKELQCPRTPN